MHLGHGTSRAFQRPHTLSYTLNIDLSIITKKVWIFKILFYYSEKWLKILWICGSFGSPIEVRNLLEIDFCDHSAPPAITSNCKTMDILPNVTWATINITYSVGNVVYPDEHVPIGSPSGIRTYMCYLNIIRHPQGRVGQPSILLKIPINMERFAAMSLFQPSNLRRAISESMDKTTKRMKYHLLGTMMGVPHTIMARNLGLLGFDFVFVDAQHAPIDALLLMQIIQTIHLSSQGKTVTIVRVPNLHSELITHALDAGAAGIVFPHVDTAEQAEEAVKLVRYPCSGGHRSLAPATLIPGKTDMAPPGSSPEQVADNNIAVICQIESPLGLENAEAIARTPGVDSLMMGPGDFRLSIGLPSKPIGGKEDPHFIQALEKLVQVSRDCLKPLMTVSFKVTMPLEEWMGNFSILCTSADLYSVMLDHIRQLRETQTVLQRIGSRRLCDVA